MLLFMLALAFAASQQHGEQDHGRSSFSWESLKEKIADFLFIVQVVGAVVMCGSQFVRFLTTVQGQSLSMMAVMEIYLVLHLALAVSAHKAKPSRSTWQMVATFLLWIVGIGSNIGAIFYNGSYQWSGFDNTTCILALVGAALVFGSSRFYGVGFSDPMPKAILAMLFKATPQLIMAFKVASEGGAGVPMAAIITGNITVLTRLAMLGISIYEEGRDRNRIWLFASETANEISWAAVSVVWVLTD
jgi:hypothetical protein